MICFYHSKDLDGHCGGAVVKARYPDCKMVGMDYVDDFPLDSARGEDVIMVDFSLQPFSRMISAANTMKSFVWIDHHSAAIKDFEACKKAYDSVNIDKIQAVLDVEFAGCELAWKAMFPDKEMPIAVKLLGRYDVWDKSDPRTDPFQLGMKLSTTDPAKGGDLWAAMFKLTPTDKEFLEIVDRGKVIKLYADKLNAEDAKRMAFPVEFEGIKFIAINKSGGSHSLGNEYDPEKYDAMMTFTYIKDGQWSVSMYSTKPDIDVSAIAKKYGGGGHRGAAGYSCKELPFLDFY